MKSTGDISTLRGFVLGVTGRGNFYRVSGESCVLEATYLHPSSRDQAQDRCIRSFEMAVEKEIQCILEINIRR